MPPSEELARRFAELCGGVPVYGSDGLLRVVHVEHGRLLYPADIAGWEGIGIVVEWLRNNGHEVEIHVSRNNTSVRIDGNFDADGDCLDAVLTAANAAIEAEPEEAR